MKKLPRLLTFLIAAAIVSTTLGGCSSKKKNPISAISHKSSGSKSELSNWKKSVDARTALDNKDYNTVEALSRKRIADKPDDASAHFMLGEALMGQKNYNAARKSFETACSLVPDNLNYSREYCKCLEALAKEATEKNEYTDAISLYKKILEKDYEPTKIEAAISDVYIASAKKMIASDNKSDADAEIVAMVVNSLLACGLRDFQIELGHVDFLTGLLEDSKFSYETCADLKDLLYNKNYLHLV